mmetsp:Transcript_171580/g.545155  ORF Transcript_171580/g.545155 Transcript_171580/m.545155 type:complete len:95 (-) Transcript_171580:157-441(-)
MVPQPWRARSGRLLRGQCKFSCEQSYFALGFPAQEKLCAARLPSRQCALTFSGITGRKFVPRSVSNVLLFCCGGFSYVRRPCSDQFASLKMPAA